MNREAAPIRAKERGCALEREAGGRAAGGHVMCAEGVVAEGTRVFVQGGCDAASGSHVLRAATMRAEVGDEFVLTEEDFPLRLSVAYANASLRGKEAFSAHTDLQLAPRIYATFYTPQIDSAGRYTLWVGVPVTFFLLSCCCCCCLCLCCGVPDDGGKAHRVGGTGSPISRVRRRSSRAPTWRRRRRTMMMRGPRAVTARATSGSRCSARQRGGSG